MGVVNQKFSESLTKNQKHSTIDWFGNMISLSDHASQLIEHELIHHGQWIYLFRSQDKKFPKSWKIWGL